jgi:FtsZ-binding cell division protein ZapB
LLSNEVHTENFYAVSSPYNLFKYAVRTEITRRYYERRIKTFFDFIGFMVGSVIEERCNSFSEKGKEANDWALTGIIKFLQYEKERVQRGEITAATLSNFVKSIKLFCEMCDISVPWKKITRGLPRPRGVANDRAPSIDEIRQLVQYPDRRIKPIIYTMASSGIRLGAWDYLKWKHIIPLHSKSGKLLAARIIVYSGESDEYYGFISPEAYNSLLSWMEFRSSYGEIITGESWVMRDIWQTSNMKYGAKFGLATNPKKFKSTGIKRLIEQGLWEQGIRTKLELGKKRHEWKAAHGFRKFYKTRTEQVMKPINVEITMGHNIGISAHYYRPSFEEVKTDYLKAVELLTFENNNSKLEREISDLKEKNNDNQYIIRGKLEEKDRQIEQLQKKQQKFEEFVQSLIDTGHFKRQD